MPLEPAPSHHMTVRRSPLKILMVCDYPQNPSRITGGTSAAAYSLVQSLLEETDAEVATFTLARDLNKLEQEVAHDGRLQIFRAPSRRYRGLVNYAGQRWAFRRVVRRVRPDIVHAQGEGLYASLAVNSKLPNVYTIHGLRIREIEMERGHEPFYRYHIQKRILLDHHNKATNIVAINEYTERGIEGLHGARVWRIPNAVQEPFFAMNDEPRVGEILLVGGVRRRKDVMTATRATAEARHLGADVRLNVVGPNDADYLGEVEAFAAAAEIAGAVEVHGLVSEEDLHELYRRADLVLLTSIEESSPICIVEGMAAGKPIVATDVGGVSEMIKHEENGYLLETGDASAIARALHAMTTDRERRDEFGARSREIAQRDWSAASVAKKTHEMYGEIVANG